MTGIIEHIDVEGASCRGYRRVKYLHRGILEYIEIEGASSSGYWRVKYL